MGLLGVYPAGHGKLDPTDLTVQCTECGEQKMVTVEFYMYLGLPPHCPCGNTKWLLVFERE
jgi:hypothetical protein